MAYLGATLLFLYYVAMPPLVGIDYDVPLEGSYMIVNKTLIEAVALVVVGVFSKANTAGLTSFFDI